MNIHIATIIHLTAIISPYSKVSLGCTILAYTVININTYVRMGCIVNTGAIMIVLLKTL